MKKKSYASPVVIIYRVELEGILAQTYMPSVGSGNIQVEDFVSGDNGNSGDILLF
jgi:hypothetical protein